MENHVASNLTPSASIVLKSSLRVAQRSPKIYSGGFVALSHNQHLIACPCDHQVKIIDLQQHKVVSTLEVIILIIILHSRTTKLLPP